MNKILSTGLLLLFHLLAYAQEDNFQFYNTEDGLSGNITLNLEQDIEGFIWVINDFKLHRFDGQKFSVHDGLPDNFVCGLLSEADSCLWLSTNKGLSRFHIQNRSFINFFKEDGISHNEFNRHSYFKARDGRMYFGGLRGITAFYPDLARSYTIEGTVKILVVISSQGKVTQAKLVDGLGFGCDEAALKLVSNMPNWKPASNYGVPVQTKKMLEFDFKLH